MKPASINLAALSGSARLTGEAPRRGRGGQLGQRLEKS